MPIRRSNLGYSVALIVALYAVHLCAPYFQAAYDFVRLPAQTSERSRWYTLEELQLTLYPDLLREGLASINADNAWASGLALLPECEEAAPLPPAQSRRVLWNTEHWEGGSETGTDVVGFPALVRNTAGLDPDGRYYLFYTIHDVPAGIGLAIAESVDSYFVKLADQAFWRIDSRVLRAPRRPRGTSHFSSPVVVWNPDEKLWFMYFHYYVNDWNRGHGHQKTALATSRNLSAGDWTPWVDERGELIAVLPVTSARWMNSQSSYHAIYRLPNGLWVAFLRGVGGAYDGPSRIWQQDPAKLGFAVSRDGRRWAQVRGNPVIHQTDGRGGRAGVYRPKFAGRLGKDLLLCWSESNYYDSDPAQRCGITNDLKTIRSVTPPFSANPLADGPMSLWNAPETLYLIDGQILREYFFPASCAAQ